MDEKLRIARQKNLRALVAWKCDGSRERFGGLFTPPKSGSYISRCLSDNPNGRKNIGEEFARQIEEVCSLQPYIMDQDGAIQNLRDSGNHLLAVATSEHVVKTSEPVYIEQMRRAVMDAAQIATPDQLLSVMGMLIGSGRSPDNRHSPPVDEILKVVEKHSLDQAEYQKTVTLLTESISEIGERLNNVVQFIERRRDNKGAPSGKERRTTKQ